jgi:hypothetical protein
MADPLTGRILVSTGVGCTVGGAALSAWGVRMLQSRRRREAAGRRTTGRVVENRTELDMENTRRVTPVVEFAAEDGVTRRVEGVWSSQEQFAVGAEVPVYYDPLRPQDSGIVGQGRLGPILLLALAAGVVGFGVLLLAVAALV